MDYTPSDTKNVALLSVATMAAGFLVLAFPYVGFPVAAFALGWVTYRFGPGPAAGLALSVGAVVAVFGPSMLGTDVLDGVFVVVALLAIGPLSAVLLKRFTALNVAIGVALIVTTAFLVSPMGAQTFAISKDMLAGFLATSAATSSVTDPAALKVASDALLKTFSDTWIASSFYTMGLSTLISIPFVARAGRSLGQPVKSYGPLADADITFHVVWPMIFGLGLTAVGTMWTQAPSWLLLAGDNVLRIARALLFIQGVAVFAALYRKMKAGRVTKAIGLVLLALTELFVPSVSVVGAVDLFANLRKIPRAGSQPKVTAL